VDNVDKVVNNLFFNAFHWGKEKNNILRISKNIAYLLLQNALIFILLAAILFVLYSVIIRKLFDHEKLSPLMRIFHDYNKFYSINPRL